MRKPLFLLLAFAAGLVSCVPEVENPAPQPGRADLSRPVFIGGSTMAGYRNGAQTSIGAERSLASFLNLCFANTQQGVLQALPPIPTGNGLGLNPKPWESLFQTASQMGTRVDCEGESSLGPVKDTFGLALASEWLSPAPSGTYNWFACPGATFADWRSPRLSLPYGSTNGNPYFARYARNSGSSTLLADAIAVQPTFFAAWPGMQDLIAVATRGKAGVNLPDAATFRIQLDSVLAALTANGAKGVLATLPDIGTLPFFTTIPARGLNLDSLQVDDLNPIYASIGLTDFFSVGENGFVVADANATSGIRQLTSDEYLCLTLPLDSVKCNLLGVLFQPIPDQYSLIAAEIAEIRTQTAALNLVIAELASQYDLAVADIAGYYGAVKDKLIVDGVTFSSTFASGNFFGLDGLYPTEKGSALLANQFVYAINAHYGASIPIMQIHQLDAVRFP